MPTLRENRKQICTKKQLGAVGVFSSLCSVMGDGFRGVQAEQDGRFKSQEKKMFAKMKFPSQFTTKVDMRKVSSLPTTLRQTCILWQGLTCGGGNTGAHRGAAPMDHKEGHTVLWL